MGTDFRAQGPINLNSWPVVSFAKTQWILIKPTLSYVKNHADHNGGISFSFHGLETSKNVMKAILTYVYIEKENAPSQVLFHKYFGQLLYKNSWTECLANSDFSFVGWLQ